jgi:hypothetical protein
MPDCSEMPHCLYDMAPICRELGCQRAAFWRENIVEPRRLSLTNGIISSGNKEENKKLQKSFCKPRRKK